VNDESTRLVRMRFEQHRTRRRRRGRRGDRPDEAPQFIKFDAGAPHGALRQRGARRGLHREFHRASSRLRIDAESNEDPQITSGLECPKFTGADQESVSGRTSTAPSSLRGIIANRPANVVKDNAKPYLFRLFMIRSPRSN
jgi:hypothetical protein